MTPAIAHASFDDREDAMSMADFDEPHGNYYTELYARIAARGARGPRHNDPDPMLRLRYLRRWARSVPQGAMAYGELRQRVVSPVCLPAAPKPHSYVQAEGRARDLEAA